MQDHPVPQNVTSYQFRLVGNMTLKQFLELGAGLALAYVIYLTNLYFFIKWPLVLLAIALGFGLAFFPIEERPLDQWIISFLKAIYNPTRYTWKKTSVRPSLFDYKPTPKEEPKKTKTVKKNTPQNLPTFKQTEPLNEIDQLVQSKESEINNLLDRLPTPTSTPSSFDVPSKPSVKIRKLSSPESLSSNIVFKSGKRILPTTTSTIITQPESQIIFDKSSQNEDTDQHIQATPDSENLLLGQEKSSKSISIPEVKPIGVDSSQVENQEETTIFKAPETIDTTITTKPTASKKDVSQAQQATSIDNYMPITPTSPNIVVGVVADTTGGIVENAIVQIIDNDGIPQRAVKTNQLGQFAISTPLPKGEYAVEVEGENLTFPIQKLKIENKIINPILIQATN